MIDDPRKTAFDILGKLKIPDPDNAGQFKTVVYQGTGPQFANWRTGLQKPRQIRAYVTQTPSNTSAQNVQRAWLWIAMWKWKNSDQTEKNRALALAEKKKLPLYQAYLSLVINELKSTYGGNIMIDGLPVTVLNTPAKRTEDGKAFIAAFGLVANASNYNWIEFEPITSNTKVFVESITIISDVDQAIRIGTGLAACTDFPTAPLNKNPNLDNDDKIRTVHKYSTSQINSVSGWRGIYGMKFKANTPMQINLISPLLVDNAHHLLIGSSVLNSELTYKVEYYHEP